MKTIFFTVNIHTFNASHVRLWSDIKLPTTEFSLLLVIFLVVMNNESCFPLAFIFMKLYEKIDLPFV
uniref:Uncharacterized protein n=1 Tax=Anguilla anguilla TaxID=7936 RepID=A0A0E9V8M8_ANGAN